MKLSNYNSNPRQFIYQTNAIVSGNEFNIISENIASNSDENNEIYQI
jgi:hypothetical protein